MELGAGGTGGHFCFLLQLGHLFMTFIELPQFLGYSQNLEAAAAAANKPEVNSGSPNISPQQLLEAITVGYAESS